MNFKGFAATYAINTRLKELIKFGLIEHHVIRVEKKREWYTLTEKGKKICEYMGKMLETVNRSF